MILPVSDIYIDGVQMPSPALDGVSVDDEKIWSSNTGRLAASGEMTGTITAIKHTVSIKWNALDFLAVRKIRQSVTNVAAWHSLRLCGPDGLEMNLTVYFGTPHFAMYSYAQGLQYCSSVSVKAIER